MKCYFHPRIVAVAMCLNCGRALCKDCLTEFEGRIICPTCFEREKKRVDIDTLATGKPRQEKVAAGLKPDKREGMWKNRAKKLILKELYFLKGVNFDEFFALWAFKWPDEKVREIFRELEDEGKIEIKNGKIYSKVSQPTFKFYRKY